jgi:cellulose synthase/poly-beta-1,6-N-acetylglucosamine synthase-like glycosyltransferase
MSLLIYYKLKKACMFDYITTFSFNFKLNSFDFENVFLLPGFCTGYRSEALKAIYLKGS